MKNENNEKDKKENDEKLFLEKAFSAPELPQPRRELRQRRKAANIREDQPLNNCTTLSSKDRAFNSEFQLIVSLQIFFFSIFLNVSFFYLHIY